MLRVSFMGNLGADPEARFTAKGTQIVSIRVAVNQVHVSAEGERTEVTEWFRARVSGRQCEYVQRLTKGSRVLVFGRLDIGHYQDKNGESRTSFDVWADDVQNMSARTGRDEESADGESRAPVAAHSRPTAPADPASEADDLDNLPF